jgi:hypothetical protein
VSRLCLETGADLVAFRPLSFRACLEFGMADFLILGRIQHLGPGEFLAIASAVPVLTTPQDAAEVKTVVTPSLDDAQAELAYLVNAVGESIRSRGHGVVDVETKFPGDLASAPASAPRRIEVRKLRSPSSFSARQVGAL